MLPTPNPAVVFQRIDDGAVLFSPLTEIYFGLNEVGAKIWELLPPASATLPDLCERLGRDYPDVERAVLLADVQDLIRQLLEAGLVTPTATHPDARNTA